MPFSRPTRDDDSKKRVGKHNRPINQQQIYKEYYRKITPDNLLTNPKYKEHRYGDRDITKPMERARRYRDYKERAPIPQYIAKPKKTKSQNKRILEKLNKKGVRYA